MAKKVAQKVSCNVLDWLTYARVRQWVCVGAGNLRLRGHSSLSSIRSTAFRINGAGYKCKVAANIYDLECKVNLRM